MKKFLLVLFVGLLALSLVAGCGQKEEPKTEPAPVEEPTTEAVPDSGTVVDSAVVEEETTEEAGH
ncbi:MAG: hypothetical protein GY865_05935 [candidate division Zixibacteria bacterium]|nr:hypothetical protein [candidate division Zixibacteria bacterium]